MEINVRSKSMEHWQQLFNFFPLLSINAGRRLDDDPHGSKKAMWRQIVVSIISAGVIGVVAGLVSGVYVAEQKYLVVDKQQAVNNHRLNDHERRILKLEKSSKVPLALARFIRHWKPQKPLRKIWIECKEGNKN